MAIEWFGADATNYFRRYILSRVNFKLGKFINLDFLEYNRWF